jgi:predicted RNase H-like HicB family nuclease
MNTATVTVMGTEKSLSPAEILKQPYHRVIVPEEDGSYSAVISEFPGCIAVGETAAEAFATLEEVAEGWLLAAIAHHQSIPEPIEEPEYSGKLVLRLPKSLHAKSAVAAERDGVSLNQFIVTALAMQIGAVEAIKPAAREWVTYNVTHTHVAAQYNQIVANNSQMVLIGDTGSASWNNTYLAVPGVSKDLLNA